MKKASQLLFALGLGLFAVGAQASLKSEMFKMQSATNRLLDATSVEEFKQSADAFISQVEQALPKLPPKTKEDDERGIEDYQRAMNHLIEVAQTAAKLADEGKLDEAKATARQIFQLKSQYHQEFK